MTRRPKQPSPAAGVRLEQVPRPHTAARHRRSRAGRPPPVSEGSAHGVGKGADATGEFMVAVLVLDRSALVRGDLAGDAAAGLPMLLLSDRELQDLLERPRGHAGLRETLAQTLASVRAAPPDLVLRRKGIKLDRLGRTVEVNRAPVDLTQREYALLQTFMQNPGRLLPRSRLVEAAWGSGGEGDGNLLDVHMSRLRAKIDIRLGRPAFKTVRGVGYELL